MPARHSHPSPRLESGAALLLVGLAGLLPLPASAADTPAPVPARTAPAADPLAPARAHIQASRWQAAIDELNRVNAVNSADWNNLMGYALRKKSPPDLDGAQRHYDTALRIDPRHQGTLEYSGELALMKGDLPTAEARLATLAGLCRSPCEPLDDLRQAIARYKANGNRY
jgi:Flp pilus assembly protein TadD